MYGYIVIPQIRTRTDIARPGAPLSPPRPVTGRGIGAAPVVRTTGARQSPGVRTTGEGHPARAALRADRRPHRAPAIAPGGQEGITVIADDLVYEYIFIPIGIGRLRL